MYTDFNDVEHFKSVLEKKYNEKFVISPVIYHTLDQIPDLTGREDEFYHFGVLTLGDKYGFKDNHPNPQDSEANIAKGVLYSGHSSQPCITIQPNSQIFDFFKILHIRNEQDELIDGVNHLIYGHFRGFIIYPADVVE